MQQAVFTHQRQEDQDRQIDNVVCDILQRINSGETSFIYSGPMAAGKTAVTIKLAKQLSQERIVNIYRLNDNRSDPGQIFSRNSILGNSENICVRLFDFRDGINRIKEDILNRAVTEGSALFISEAQFAGNESENHTNSKDWEELFRLAEELGIIICDALSSFYNLQPVPDTQYLRNRIPNNFNMRACDSFDQTRFATMSMRMVAIDAQDGSVVDELDQQHSKYYMEVLSSDERLELIERVKFTEFSELLRTERNGRVCYLVPSHPTIDDSFIPGGNERYFPTSLKTCKKILTAYGLNNVRSDYIQIFINNLREKKGYRLDVES
jgi:thymidine kinase